MAGARYFSTIFLPAVQLLQSFAMESDGNIAFLTI
jgi:hypothetical protein